jgi:hypothetical protein
MFDYNTELKTIDCLIYIKSGTNTTNMFRGCTKLENFLIAMDSGIKLDLSDSPKLSYDSVKTMLSVECEGQRDLVLHKNTYAKITGDDTNSAYTNLTDDEKTEWTSLLSVATKNGIVLSTKPSN